MSQALHTSPFDPQIANLTEPQITWILLNVYKDDEEEAKKQEMLLRFINPKLGQEVFDKIHQHTEFDDDDFMKEIKAHVTESVDDTKLRRSIEHPKDVEETSNLDTIERVD